MIDYKIAANEEEFTQIHRLNYRTFAEEIPQHPTNQERSLIDRFHAENTYVIGKRGQEVIAMVSFRCNRPFSLDAKLPALDSYLPRHASLCELRLLAVEPRHRRTRVFYELMKALFARCWERGHDLAVISGTIKQRRLYRHFGFRPFGPTVGTQGARFQPMMLELSALLRSAPHVE
jgi:GNAT superfamily N-acetyltransferase